MRTIMHVDLDAFYSALEQRDHPELRGKPVIVGGDPDGRGVVATASYEARKSGVGSAMPCRTARRLCPDAIFLRPRFDVYADVSRDVMAVLREVSPVLETISLDEAFVDVSGRAPDAASAEHLGRQIKDRIRETTRLT